MTWWVGLPDVETPGPDEAPHHPLVWRQGELRLAAHPDPEADEALGALGGDRCACLDVLDAWRAVHDDGSILTVGARHAADAVRPPAATTSELRAELRRWRAASGSLVEEARLSRDTKAIDRIVAIAGPAERRAGRRLAFLMLLAVDPRLLRRLQASVAAAFAGDEARWPQLTVATAARARPALAAIGWRGGLSSITLGPAAEVGEDHAVLPPTWLGHVWGRGLEQTAADHLVVEVSAVAGEGRFDVIAMAPGKFGVASRVGPVGE